MPQCQLHLDVSLLPWQQAVLCQDLCEQQMVYIGLCEMQTLTEGIDGASETLLMYRGFHSDRQYTVPHGGRHTGAQSHTYEHARTHKDAGGNIIYASLTDTAVLVSMKCSICD